MQNRRWLMVLVLVVTLVALVVTPAPAYTQEGHEWITRHAFHQLVHDAGECDVRLHAETNAVKKVALRIKAEAMWETVNFYNGHLNLLARAVQEPDDLGKMSRFSPNTTPIFHGWNPKTDRGWLNSKGARWLASEYWKKMQAAGQRSLAQNEIFTKRRTEEEAIGHLGIVLHLVEDMTVPHHLKLNVNDGHYPYESDIPLWYGSYVMKYSGVYGFGTKEKIKEDPTDLYAWFHYAASQSLPEYPKVGSLIPETQRVQQAKHYKAVARKLVPTAIACTAGVMYHAYWAMQCKPAPYMSHIEYSPPPRK
jgi:hypothetical protein